MVTNGQFAVRELTINDTSPTAGASKTGTRNYYRKLATIAVQDGMLTMLQDGVLRVLVGETSLEEVLRVLA